MTDQEIADLYARCFPDDVNLWKAEAIEQLRKGQHSKVFETAHGAVFLQMAADEGEILSIFVDPDHQGNGEGAKLLGQIISCAMSRGIRTLFLEVAADNQAALSLYAKFSFMLIGKRKDYYLRRSGSKVDAFTMRCDL